MYPFMAKGPERSNRNFTDKLNKSRRYKGAFRFRFRTSGKQSAGQRMTRIPVLDQQNDVRAIIRMALQVNRFDLVEDASAAGLRAFGWLLRRRYRRYPTGEYDGYHVIAVLRDRVAIAHGCRPGADVP